MMRFFMRYTEIDSSGYYYPRWDRAVPIEIVADTEKEAAQKLLKIIGKPARHDKWGYKLDKIVAE